MWFIVINLRWLIKIDHQQKSPGENPEAKNGKQKTLRKRLQTHEHHLGQRADELHEPRPALRGAARLEEIHRFHDAPQAQRKGSRAERRFDRYLARSA